MMIPTSWKLQQTVFNPGRDRLLYRYWDSVFIRLFVVILLSLCGHLLSLYVRLASIYSPFLSLYECLASNCFLFSVSWTTFCSHVAFCCNFCLFVVVWCLIVSHLASLCGVLVFFVVILYLVLIGLFLFKAIFLLIEFMFHLFAVILCLFVIIYLTFQQEMLAVTSHGALTLTNHLHTVFCHDGTGGSGSRRGAVPPLATSPALPLLPTYTDTHTPTLTHCYHATTDTVTDWRIG